MPDIHDETSPLSIGDTLPMIAGARDSERFKSVPFLETLGKDHPELAERIKSGLPSWSRAVDGYMGIPDFSRSLLQHVDYVSNEETEHAIQTWADSVTQYHKQNPEEPIVFLHLLEGSDRYFAWRVLEKLPEEVRRRVQLMDCLTYGELADRLHTNDVAAFTESLRALPKSLWFFDDSSNSGAQLRNVVATSVGRLSIYTYLSTYFPEEADRMDERITELQSEHGDLRDEEIMDLIMSENPHVYSQYFSYIHALSQSDMCLNIRFLRMTESAGERVGSFWKKWGTYTDQENNEHSLSKIDISYPKKITDIQDVLDDLHITDPQTVLKACTGIGPGTKYSWPPTLTIFSHKLQDNLSRFLLDLQSATDFKDKTGEKPLFSPNDIIPPYRTSPQPETN